MGIERLNELSDAAIAKAFREHTENCVTPATRWIEERARDYGAALSQTAGVAEPGRYFADGPQGHFFADDLQLARDLVNLYDKDEDWTITDLRNPTGAAPAASGGDISHVTIDFPQVGTAGPFKVIDGRMTLPDVTMNDLIHHARMGYVLASNSPSASSVSERARELLEQSRNGRALRNDGLVEVGQAIDAIEQALTQQRGAQLGDFQVAWDAVCEALNLVCPEWTNNGQTGLQSAVITIQKLAAATPQPSADAVRDDPGNDPRVNDDSFAAAIRACRSQLGARRPCDSEPEEQWMWDKLTKLESLLSAASGEKGVGNG